MRITISYKPNYAPYCLHKTVLHHLKTKKEARCKCHYPCTLIYGLNSPLLHNNLLTNNTLYLAGLPFLAANYSDSVVFFFRLIVYIMSVSIFP